VLCSSCGSAILRDAARCSTCGSNEPVGDLTEHPTATGSGMPMPLLPPVPVRVATTPGARTRWFWPLAGTLGVCVALGIGGVVLVLSGVFSHSGNPPTAVGPGSNSGLDSTSANGSLPPAGPSGPSGSSGASGSNGDQGPGSVMATETTTTTVPGGGAGEGLVTVASGVVDPDAPAIRQSLDGYFSAINQEQYGAAWDYLDGYARNNTDNGSETKFASGFDGTQDSSIVVTGVSPVGSPSAPPGAVSVNLRFTSVQQANSLSNNQGCDNWTMTYWMVDGGGIWMIDRVPVANRVAC